MDKLAELRKKIEQARAVVDQLEEEYRVEANLERQKVDFTRRGDTWTLVLGPRKLKVTKNNRGRYRVVENGRVVDGDYTDSLHNLKLALVQGRI